MKQILLSLLLSSSISANAQGQMAFSYDSAGNRVSRVVVLDKSSAKSRQAKPIQSFFDERGGKQVKVCPNSSTGHVLVEMLGKFDNDVKLSVFNTSGMQLYSQVFKNDRMDVDLSNNPSGIYILTIEIDGERQSWKILKK